MHCRALRRDGSRREVVEDPRRRGGQSQRCGRGEDGPVVGSLCLLLRRLVARRSVRAVTGFSNEQRTRSRKRLDPAQQGVGTPCRTVPAPTPAAGHRPAPSGSSSAPGARRPEGEADGESTGLHEHAFALGTGLQRHLDITFGVLAHQPSPLVDEHPVSFCRERLPNVVHPT
jgi:hypothetical protein